MSFLISFHTNWALLHDIKLPWECSIQTISNKHKLDIVYFPFLTVWEVVKKVQLGRRYWNWFLSKDFLTWKSTATHSNTFNYLGLLSYKEIVFFHFFGLSFNVFFIIGLYLKGELTKITILLHSYIYLV